MGSFSSGHHGLLHLPYSKNSLAEVDRGGISHAQPTGGLSRRLIKKGSEKEKSLETVAARSLLLKDIRKVHSGSEQSPSALRGRPAEAHPAHCQTWTMSASGSSGSVQEEEFVSE